MADTLWCGREAQKLYLQSGQFSSTLKTSLSVSGVDTGVSGISWDGTNTPWCGFTADKLYLQSGQFSSTLKTSLAIGTVDNSPQGISYDGTNTPWCGNQADKLYLQSGQFSSTLKTSLDVSVPTDDVEGISWDGANTPWIESTNDRMLLGSGQFSSTIKDSLDVTSIDTNPQDISWDGTNTPWIGAEVKLYLHSGQFESTLKTSLDLTGIDTGPTGTEHGDYAARTTVPPSTHWAKILTANPANIAVDDYCKLTADDIIGRTYAEVKTDLDLETGTDLQAWDASLDSIAGLTYASPSFIKLTAEDTYAVRTLQETSDDLEATIDHDNLLNFASNEHYLQSAITQVGTIATGVWEGTGIDVAHGGTGLANITDHKILVGSGTGAITLLGVMGNGVLLIGSAGADPQLGQLAGTANQIAIANASGSITLSLPQDYHTGASPQLAGINLGHASDTTLTRVSAGVVAVEGTNIAMSGGAFHDGFSDSVGNEHIDHTGVTLTAGSGIAGGGDISTGRTFDLDINSLSAAAIAAGDFIPFWDITATATNKKITFANFEAALNHNALTNYASNEHYTQASITAVGTIASGTWQGTTVALNQGGTGETTAQLAINALSAVSGATNEHVLTKDTATGNAVFKAAAGGADAFTVKVDAGATAGYIGAADSDGVLRTGSGLTYADGGNFVTLTAESGGGVITLFGQHIDSVTQGTWIIAGGSSYLFFFTHYNSTHNDGDEIHFSAFMGAGTYTCKLLGQTNTNQGIAKIYIDANLVATFDKYGALSNQSIFTQTAISVAASGVKDIKLVIDGKHASSSDHYCHFNFLSFYRTA